MQTFCIFAQSMKRNLTIATIATYVVVLGALWLFPIGATWVTAVTIVVVWAITGYVYSLTKAPTTAGWAVLLCCAALLTIGAIVNTYTVTTLKGLPPDTPDFNNFDMKGFWSEAMGWMNGDPYQYEHRGRWGYGVLITLLWMISGSVNLFVPLMGNALFTLLSIIVSGIVVRTVLDGNTDRTNGWLQTAGMIFTAAVTYFLFSGTLLLREAVVGFAVSLMALGVVRSLRSPWSMWIILFLCGATIIAALRPSWSILPCLGAVAMLGRSPKRVSVSLFALAFVIAQWSLFELFFRNMGNIEIYSEPDSAFAGIYYLHDTPSRHVFNHIFGELYFSQSILGRIALLPIAAGIQYMLPLPWSFLVDIDTAPTLMLVKFTYPWYAIGGLIIYYIFISTRKALTPRSKASGSINAINRLLVWGVIYWIGTVWASGGSVARYGVPLLPLAIPAAVWVWSQCIPTPNFRRYAIGYTASVAACLICAHLIQNS